MVIGSEFSGKFFGAKKQKQKQKKRQPPEVKQKSIC